MMHIPLLASAGMPAMSGGGGGWGGSPDTLDNLECWHQYQTGLTLGVGDSIAQWADQSGNARHLAQSTDANRPTGYATGEVTFAGSHWLDSAAWASSVLQPFTIYILGRQDTWKSLAVFMDGATLFRIRQRNSGAPQFGATPDVDFWGGSAWSDENSDWTVGQFKAAAFVHDGANSLSQIGSAGTPVTGSWGTGAFIAAHSLGGAWTSGDPTYLINATIKEVIIYSEAHDAGLRSEVMGYLEGL